MLSQTQINQVIKTFQVTSQRISELQEIVKRVEQHFLEGGFVSIQEIKSGIEYEIQNITQQESEGQVDVLIKLEKLMATKLDISYQGQDKGEKQKEDQQMPVKSIENGDENHLDKVQKSDVDQKHPQIKHEDKENQLSQSQNDSEEMEPEYGFEPQTLKNIEHKTSLIQSDHFFSPQNHLQDDQVNSQQTQVKKELRQTNGLQTQIHKERKKYEKSKDPQMSKGDKYLEKAFGRQKEKELRQTMNFNEKYKDKLESNFPLVKDNYQKMPDKFKRVVKESHTSVEFLMKTFMASRIEKAWSNPMRTQFSFFLFSTDHWCEICYMPMSTRKNKQHFEKHHGKIFLKCPYYMILRKGPCILGCGYGEHKNEQIKRHMVDSHEKQELKKWGINRDYLKLLLGDISSQKFNEIEQLRGYSRVEIESAFQITNSGARNRGLKRVHTEYD